MADSVDSEQMLQTAPDILIPIWIAKAKLSEENKIFAQKKNTMNYHKNVAELPVI